MTSFVKRELLKHLTRFAKNIDPAKVNISAVRGEGELSGLELDEQVLMNLLELPTWLAIKSATCNRLSIKIPWTSLKSRPIGIYLDCVNLVMETCDELRKDGATCANLSSSGESAKYGFVERVVDGIYVHVSSVVISFRSYAFSANIDLSQINVESVGPHWDRVDDLRRTRVKDETRGQVIIFKRIQLGVIRVALNAMDPHDAPILLISNNSEVQVAIKKKLSDCGFVASKVKLIVEDLLWVLNDSQIKAVISYMNMLKPLILRAHKANQLKSGGVPDHLDNEHTRAAAAASSSSSSASFRLPKNDQEVRMCKIFDLNDVMETSYHLVCRRIDLHLVEDNSKKAMAESAPLRLEGGALQLSLRNLCLDHYPYHLVANSIQEISPLSQTFYHWENYSDLFETRNMWANQLITAYKEVYMKVKNEGKIDDLVSAELNFFGNNPLSVEARARKQKKPVASALPVFVPQRLMSSCFVLFLDSYALHHVTSNKTSGTEVMNGKFVYSDKSTFHIPSDVPSILAIYTDYYFTSSGPASTAPPNIHIQQGSRVSSARAASASAHNSKESSSAVQTLQGDINQLPLPHANLHVKFNPFCLDFDPETLVWLSAFARRVSKNVQIPEMEKKEVVLHVDLKVEFLMPQVKLTLRKHPEDQPDRPRGLEVAMSCVTMTNVHNKNKSARDNLGKTIDQSFLANQKSSFESHPLELNKGYGKSFPSHTRTVSSRGTNMLRHPGFLDAVFIEVDQIWSDWFGIKTTRLGRLPFIDPISISVFVSYPALQSAVLNHLDQSERDAVASQHTLNQVPINNTPTRSGQPGDVEHNMNGNLVTPDLLRSCSKQSNENKSNQRELHRDRPKSIPNAANVTCSNSEPLVEAIFTTKKKIVVYLDHYQFIVLMRLQEMLLQTLESMEHDKKLILGNQVVRAADAKELKVAITGILPALDVVFTMPPQIASEDLMATRRSLLLSSTFENQINDDVSHSEGRSGSDVSSSKNQCTEAASESLPVFDPEPNGHLDTEIPESLPFDDLPTLLSEQLSTVPSITVAQSQETSRDNLDVTSDTSVTGRRNTASSDKNLNNVSSSGYSTSAKVNSQPGKVTLSTLSSAAGSLTAKFSSAGSLVGKTFTDTMSITGSEFSAGSGGYSSEDDFICLSADGAGIARMASVGSAKVVDYDQELKPVNTYKPDEEFLGEERNEMPVTVLVARLKAVEASVQLLGDNGCSVIHLAVPHLTIEDHQNTTFSKFLNNNAKLDRELAVSGETNHDDLSSSTLTLPEVEVRIDSPGQVAGDLYGGCCAEKGHLYVSVEQLKQQVKMTCLMGLLDLIEDELIQPVAPLDLMVHRSDVTIVPDGPPVNPLTSPGPVPLNLKISDLKLCRDVNLDVHIGTDFTSVSGSVGARGFCSQGDVLNGGVDGDKSRLESRNKELELQLREVKRQLDEALSENTVLQTTLRNMQSTLLTSTNTFARNDSNS